MTTTGRIWRSVVNPSLLDRARRFFFWLTGGRPMIRGAHAFVDVVTGESVWYFRDRDMGARWLATGPFSLFRVHMPRWGPKDDEEFNLSERSWTWRRDR